MCNLMSNAKLKKFDIHPDFASLPACDWPFNPCMVPVLNGILSLEVYLRSRHILNKARKHTVETADDPKSTFTIYHFLPDDLQVDETLPALLYFHGGAFVYTYQSAHVKYMDAYAQKRYAVFMVDYRLGPKHIFPKPFDDCWTSLVWLTTNSEQLKINKDKIVLAGDSAGGCLVAAIAQKVKDEGNELKIKGQMMIFPVLDKNCNTESATIFNDTPMFSGTSNKKMWDVYLGEYHNESTPQYASPSERSDLTGLAPAYIENAEYDPLRDEADDYAKRLQSAGVQTTLHSTIEQCDVFKQVGKIWYAKTCSMVEMPLCGIRIEIYWDVSLGEYHDKPTPRYDYPNEYANLYGLVPYFENVE